MKDNFSLQSLQYFQYRPTYPNELFDFLISLTLRHENAWDCGTGNGQLAVKLAEYFERVFATDLSENQIKHAVKKENIIYKVERAEKTDFINNQFDLITVAQAIHWFSFDDFYKEVYRTLRPNGIFAVIGYALLKINPFIDNIINKFYTGVIRNYWDKERRYIDENYLTIPFPFEELKAPVICSQHEWTFEQLTGYLNTWSAIQPFIKENRSNPVDTIINQLKESWASDERKQVCFPILLRVGRKYKHGYH